MAVICDFVPISERVAGFGADSAIRHGPAAPDGSLCPSHETSLTKIPVVCEGLGEAY